MVQFYDPAKAVVSDSTDPDKSGLCKTFPQQGATLVKHCGDVFSHPDILEI